MHITHEDARQRQDEQIRQLQAQVGHIRQNTNEEVQAAQSTWISFSVSFVDMPHDISETTHSNCNEFVHISSTH